RKPNTSVTNRIIHELIAHSNLDCNNDTGDTTITVTQRTQKANTLLIVGSIIGLLTSLCLMGVIWRFWRRRKNQTSVDSERRSLNNGDTHIAPYPPPGAIEIVENRGRLWKNRGLLNGANVLNLSTPDARGTSIENRESEKPQEDTPQIEHSRETIGARENGKVTGQITEPLGGGIFRHTDSG
ncbi:hypothetical protein PQX77_016302, partial [Marasmius sp. AFHP31]